MKKRVVFLSAAIALTAMAASASGKWTLQSKDYTVDTLFHAKIGPGTTQTSLALSGGSRLNIFYITTDLTDPNVDIRVAQAGSRLTGGAKLSAMSNANTNATTGIEYFAGVNADFFGNSQPIGATVVNGDVYKAPGSSTWINWYMNDSKVPGIEQLQFAGTATGPAATHPLTAINDSRYTDYLVLYNSHYAATTGTNQYGSEVLVSADRAVGFNGKYTCTVVAAPVAGAGSMTIPSGQYVLSGHGTGAAFVNSLKAGDKVELDLTAQLATGGTVTQMAGGQPIILQNGETLNTQNALDHLTALNPRTAVGYNADRTKLVLLVVDGRGMGGSAGVVSKVLADIMRCVGCSDAMNFDGGGSSELYTRAFGVRNRPSDGTERTVVNSVWAVSTAPADKNVAELAFTAPSISLPKYGYYKPSFYAYNQYGVLLSVDFKGAQLSCPPELGEIVDGTTLFANGSGTHPLTATYNGVTTTIMVTIGSAAPRARLDKVIVDGYRSYPIEVVATVEGEDMSIDNSAFEWSIDNPAVAEVSANGLLSGIANGTATVTATVDNSKLTLPVTVEKPASHYVNINEGGTIEGWTTSKSGLSTATLSALGNGFAVDYKLSSTRSPYFSIKPSSALNLYSLPDSVRLVVNPGNATINKITVTAAPEGERGVASAATVSLTPNANNVILFPVSDFCDVKDMASYPVTLSQIRFDLGGSVGQDTRVEIPELATVHNAVSGQEGVEAILPDSNATGLALSTNVAYRGTVVGLPESTTWTVCNMAGAIVAQGNGTAIDTALLAPGNYVVSTPAGAARLLVR